jgi:cellulose synthase/poly-beta-1,6-N-acetylglucosamine synthase-like glycosyltransferase
MNGRIGWAHIKSLLIISGAFGVFDREKVVAIHGYLTSREVFDKDTVGEDMELVVRLSRMLREKKKRFAVHYAYAANCWTEVPSSFKILKRQRNRWQRGLIDILFFHSKLLFNPRYGAMGIVAFPYYLLFEVIGPWLESFALLLIVPALLSGWSSAGAALFGLSANILLGSALSMASLAIAEWDKSVFRLNDKVKLVLAAIAENFGFRQWMGLYRLNGFIDTIRGVTGWGAMSRKGFTGKGVTK